MFRGDSFFFCAKMHFPKRGFCEIPVDFATDYVKFLSIL